MTEQEIMAIKRRIEAIEDSINGDRGITARLNKASSEYVALKKRFETVEQIDRSPQGIENLNKKIDMILEEVARLQKLSRDLFAEELSLLGDQLTEMKTELDGIKKFMDEDVQERVGKAFGGGRAYIGKAQEEEVCRHIVRGKLSSLDPYPSAIKGTVKKLQAKLDLFEFKLRGE